MSFWWLWEKPNIGTLVDPARLDQGKQIKRVCIPGGVEPRGVSILVVNVVKRVRQRCDLKALWSGGDIQEATFQGGRAKTGVIGSTGDNHFDDLSGKPARG